MNRRLKPGDVVAILDKGYGDGWPKWAVPGSIGVVVKDPYASQGDYPYRVQGENEHDIGAFKRSELTLVGQV